MDMEVDPPPSSSSMELQQHIKTEPSDQHHNSNHSHHPPADAESTELELESTQSTQSSDEAGGEQSQQPTIRPFSLSPTPSDELETLSGTTPSSIPSSPGSSIAFEEEELLFQTSGFKLQEIVEKIDQFKPTIPEPLCNYLLHNAGFQTSDPRVGKLISIAAQKFIADILNDAFTHCKLRTAAPIGGGGGSKQKSKDKKYVLTLEDLGPVLQEYGITVKKPPYFV